MGVIIVSNCIIMSKHIRLFIICTLLILPFASQAQKVKLVSFNIRYNSVVPIDGENVWENRRDAVARMILEECPDAIGLQEALFNQLEYLDKKLLRYRRVGVGRDDGIREGEFMAIYYNIDRLELISHKTRWLSETPLMPSLGWDAACRRTVTVARFRVKDSGREFVYLNTHLDHVGPMARANSARQIATIAAEASVDGTPVVVGGDMNSTIEDSIFDAFYTGGLCAARSLTHRTSNAITYNAFGKDAGSIIDHFFVRGFKVRRFRTLNGDFGVPYISDHYPIEINVRL